MQIENVLTLENPQNPLPLIFDSPHSGTIYPPDFNYTCDFTVLERAEDKYVDELFAAAPAHGAPLLCALFPRSYIDVNRSMDDIDLELLAAKWPATSAIHPNPSNRSLAGIGLVRRLISPNNPIYTHKLSHKDIMWRIETYYTPYHAALDKLINDAHQNYGQVWHINCHSMPSASVIDKINRINPAKPPDFVLGDRDGTSCDVELTHLVRDFLKSKGYKVAINNPYKGVELVSRYSAPSMGRHSLQIEISKALYMNEQTSLKSKNFDKLRMDMTALIAHLADYAQSNLIPLAAD